MNEREDYLPGVQWGRENPTSKRTSISKKMFALPI